MSRPDAGRWRDERWRRKKRNRRLKRNRYRGRRTDLPRQLWRSLDLSDFDSYFTRKWLIENLTSQPFWPLIDQATRIDKEEGTSGRPPLDGSWALFLCVFIFSKEVSLTRFLAKMKRKHWRAIGFDDPPSKSTVWDNLERIELTCLGVFTDAAWLLIRRVDRATGGDVLRDWWWDTTRSLSPSRYYHCCDRDECPKQRIRKQRAQGQAEKRRPKPRRPLRPGQIERAHGLPDDPNADDGEVTSEARAQLRPGQPDPLQNDEDYRKAGSRGVPQLPTRQALIRRLYGEQEAARDAAGLDPEGLVKTTRSPLLLARDALDVERSRIGLCPHSNHAADHYAGLILDYTGPGRFFTLKSTGCLYYTADAEAAVRRKSDRRGDERRPQSRGDAGEEGDEADGRRYQSGDSSPKLVYDVSRLVSLGMGAPINLLVDSKPESYLYPPLLEDTLDRSPHAPRAVVSDSGGAVPRVADANAEYGIAHVTPSRGYGKELNHRWEDDKHGRWDAFCIPRCRHCGGPCRFVKARPQRSTSGEERWRVLFECVRREKDACEKTQGRYLDEDTRKVTTIWRDREVWHALLHARGNHERSNLHERKRWHVSTDHHLVRRNRKGLRFQQLCGEIAILLTWLKAAWLQGLVDGKRRVPAIVAVVRAIKQLDKFTREYRKLNLNQARPDFVAARAAYEATRVRKRRPQDEQRE